MNRYAKQRYREQLFTASPKCRYCGRRIGRRATLDHVRPRSRGGADRRYNLVLACRACQHRKGNWTPGELLQWAFRIFAAQFLAIVGCVVFRLRIGRKRYVRTFSEKV